MDLEARAKAAGVETGYEDYKGDLRRSPESSVQRVLEALELEDQTAYDRGPLVLRRGDSIPFDRPAMVNTENGEQHAVEGTLPGWLPFGYHTVHGDDGSIRRLIVSPGTCYPPENLNTWGWAAQLYSLRARWSWGMGDLADLEQLTRWSASKGAGTVMINPLGAATPGRSIQPSPYYPSTRSFRNPLYLGIDLMEGADDPTVSAIRESATDLNKTPLINRNAVWAAKEAALELLFERFDGAAEFDHFCDTGGRSLDDFAAFCALAETHPGTPAEWPGGLQHPGSPEVDAFREKHTPRLRFHKWLQWQLDVQLAKAGSHLRLLQDLPVGVDPAGADAWIWGDAFAEGFELGAPPDEFNRAGQSWGIAGFHPSRLRACGYEPFIQMIRSQLAHAGGLRIDHVMGLFRLYWIPSGCDPSEGVYVRYPTRDLLDIVALESHRAQAFVVGEDLGTVEPHVREQMAARSMLSYRLLIFEDSAESIPKESMAAVTTHDLPTLAGIWTGEDLKAQKNLGLPVAEDGTEQMVDRLSAAAAMPAGSPLEDVIPAVHRTLAGCPARIVLATLEDAAAAVDRPNMPGFTEGWPNWSLPLPRTLEEIMESPEAARVIDAISAR